MEKCTFSYNPLSAAEFYWTGIYDNFELLNASFNGSIPTLVTTLRERITVLDLPQFQDSLLKEGLQKDPSYINRALLGIVTNMRACGELSPILNDTLPKRTDNTRLFPDIFLKSIINLSDVISSLGLGNKRFATISLLRNYYINEKKNSGQ